MFFVSTPSLAISLVLAVFYLANLVFVAANRQQDTPPVVAMEDIGQESEWRLRPASLLWNGDENTLKKKAHSEDIQKPDIFAVLVERDTSLPDLPFSIFDSGICWKLFSRPPPVC